MLLQELISNHKIQAQLTWQANTNTCQDAAATYTL